MVIFINESAKTELNQNQIKSICRELYNRYKKYINPTKKLLAGMKDLSKVSYMGDLEFIYRKFDDTFYGQIAGFENYAWEKHASGKDAIKLFDDFKKDLMAFQSNAKKAFKGVSFVFMDEEGNDLASFTKFMKDSVKEYDETPSNNIDMFISVKRREFEKLIPSDKDIKDADRKKYLGKYDEFAKFLKHPHRIGGSFFHSGTIAAICQIIGMSNDNLNSIVSKNIKGMKVEKFNPIPGLDDDGFSEYLSRRIGDHYTVESFDADIIVYSIDKKKLFWVNYEHGDVEEFYSNYPFIDEAFEDALYGDDDARKYIRNLYKEYDSSKRYNLFK